MKKKLVFVVDTEKQFIRLINSVCPPDKIELQFHSSAVEIVSSIAKEKPVSIFLNLETPDINDFVMHDLLKKAENCSIPVYITYSKLSENELKKYQQLKYKAKDYLQKPVPRNILENIFASIPGSETDTSPEFEPPPVEKIDEPVIESDEIDENEFSDENIDKLIRGDYLEVDNEDHAPALSDTKNEMILNLEEAVSPNNAQPIPPKGGKDRKVDRELEVQVISLESQNEFLRAENKKLSASVQSFNEKLKEADLHNQRLRIELDNKSAKSDESIKKSESDKMILLRKVEVLEKQTEQLEDQKSDLTRKLRSQELQGEKLENEKIEFQKQVEDLTNRLTDKERELVARNHKFEVELKKKLDEVLQQTEDRFLTEFKQKENRINHEFIQVRDEKKEIELKLFSINEEISKLKDIMQTERQEFTKREDTLNRTISVLAEEKITFSEKIVSMEEDITRRITEMNQKEARIQTALENLKKESDENRAKLDYHKQRLLDLSKLLQNALSLTDIENENH